MRPELKALVKARVLLLDPSKWGRGRRGKDRPHETFDIAEAIEQWPNLDERREAFKTFKRANGILDEWGTLVEWNDDQSHEGVLAALDRAIKEAA